MHVLQTYHLHAQRKIETQLKIKHYQRERNYSCWVFGYGKEVTQKCLKQNSTSSTVNFSSMDKLVNEKVSETRIQELEQKDKIRESELQEMKEREKISESKFEELIAHISFLESAVMAALGYQSNKDAYP